jgi:hypothetical protein
MHLLKMHFEATMGRLGATVAGTIRVLLVAIPKTSTEKRRLQMNKFRFTIKLLAIAIFMFAFASLAQAQATRTWVSGVGDDVNPCSRTAPCKTFAGAISKTAIGGEIDCLDPGGFGAVTITKSLTIDGTHGAGFGGILASLTNGVIVNGAGAIVTLRSLSINGGSTAQPGLNGIRFIQGSKLLVEDCKIFNFTGGGGTAGIDVQTGAAATVHVKDSTIYANTRGIRATTTAGLVVVIMENTTIQNNAQEGVKLETGGFVTARNSSIASNGSGVSVTSSNAGANLLHCVVLGNTGAGLAAGTSTNVRIGGSSFIGNGNISQSAPNNIKTFGDNYIVDGITGGAIQLIPPQ